MRKISIFSLILSLIFAIFFGISSVFAQKSNGSAFDHFGQKNSPKVQYCNDGHCTLKEGVNDGSEALGNNITTKPVSEYAQDVVIYLMTFVTIIGVIYVIWSGFRIMISAGDEDTVANSRKTILYVAIGIIVMWLAYSIVNFVIKFLEDTRTGYNPREKTHFAFNLVPTAHAQAYTESDQGTFNEYKYRVQVAAEELEAELRVNKKASASKISQLKSLVQQAFDRLPDRNAEAARINESNKRLVDMYLDLASKEPDSQQAVGTAISQVATFVSSAKIEAVQGSISANPTTGNAPLVTSFSAQNVVDPSGTIPPNGNYIWWIRENGGGRRELGRGPSLTYEFSQEGTYTVNLDVISASRNKKRYTDVLPLSTSVNIQVQPKLGEITLLVNGINVSNMSEMKISPTIAAQGLIFDATASRAIGNGRILETNWDFGNGNTRKYNGRPGAERQIFATSGDFPVKLTFKTNDGQTFSKDIMLRIKDPAATIKVDRTTANAGEAISFTAETYFGNVRNVEYLWTVQSNDTGKRDTQSGNGTSFNYTFKDIGSYTVTLTAKSPNGEIDSDSKTITIESREPIATLDAPKSLNSEQPNTFIFDASRSYDPDTNSRQGLTYTWRLNGELIKLDELANTSTDQKNSRGTYTFDTTGENTIQVTVANKHGKIGSAEQKFNVTSILSGDMRIASQVAKVGDEVSFLAISKNAKFFTWNMGDGSPQTSGSARAVTHKFKTTGIYNVSVTLQGESANDTTTITRKVYITDMDSPLAIINFTNSSNSVVMESGVCDGKDAYILNRGESTTLNGGNSVNVDGTTTNLDYTWRFMGKVSTLSTISENFKDLGCFPISLTVKSKTNGASHTTTEYIKLNNQPPQLTNITTTIDASKKDSQKIIVKATANGANDPDGVVTSYIWYYTTESDNEPQGLQITQSPTMTFVLPNVTEKYYFGVIIEDNDGMRVDSKQILSSQTPLIIDNENSNIHLPLITLHVPNKVIKVGQNVTFSAEAKTITGNNVTNKAQYAWDFDGDGRIDEKTSTPSVSHTFTKAGDYNLRVRVTNNGVTNTKYHTIHVRNELKASVQGYKISDDKLFLLNTSQGVYDKAKWTIGNYSSTQLESVTLDVKDVPNADADGKIGTLQISSNDTDISNVDIILKNIETIAPSENGEIVYQSFPKAENDVITISDPSQVVKLSLFGNTATAYAIDTDLDMDGTGDNMDGVTDNDIDNREHQSYQDGSLFTISDFSYARTRERKIKITLYDGVTPTKTKTIKLLLDFIPENSTTDNDFQNIDADKLTDFEKERLETLASMIRNLDDVDRIILMQEYNVLVENWMSPFEKAKKLVDLQLLVESRNNIKQDTRDSFSKIIDELLIGDADTTNAITVATTLIKNLLPPNSANYNTMVEKIDAIASHPTDRATNKTLGEELLALIQQEPSSNLSDEYKSMIHQQLQFILDQGKISDTTPPTDTQKSSSGILSTLGTVLWIFLGIIGVVVLVVLGLFIFYKIKSTDENLGFQDFIIDQFSGKKSEDTTPIAIVTPTPSVETILEETKVEEVDPLKSYTPPSDIAMDDPLGASEAVAENISENTDGGVPDWLKPAENTEIPENISENNAPTENADAGGLPDWLKPATEANAENPEDILSETPTPKTEGGLPDWLAAPTENTEIAENPEKTEEIVEEKIAENPANNPLDIDENFSYTSQKNASESPLPDWLSGGNSEAENISENISETEISTPNESDNENNLPDWLKSGAENTAENTAIEEENIDENVDKNPPTENAALPDWIVDQAKDLEATNEENSFDATEEISENPENNAENSEVVDIPDWIKNPPKTREDWLENTEESEENTENLNNETDDITKKFEEKIEKEIEQKPRKPKKSSSKAIKKSEKSAEQSEDSQNSDESENPHDNIPEWLK